MNEYSGERAKQTALFEAHLRRMIQHELDDGLEDCFIVFSEEPPDGCDVPHLEEANSKVPELVITDGDSAAADGDDFMDQSSIRIPNNADSSDGSSGGPPDNHRYVQFAFKSQNFYMELPQFTLYPAEAESLLSQRSGFFHLSQQRHPTMSLEYWQKVVADWNPVHKIYLNSDARSAAEDMAFIFFTLWKFPPDWQFYYSAEKFSARPPRGWEGEGPVK